MRTVFFRGARQMLAVVFIAISYAAVRTPSPGDFELAQIAGPLRFTAETIGRVLDGQAQYHMRRVHPTLNRIAGWISSVGAGIALADIDGDGLSNDACHVDPRTDTVTVLPVPGTPNRYAPIVLSPPGPDLTASAPMGCVPGDMDEDGRLDLLVYYWGRTPVAFLQRGHGRDLAFTPIEIVPGGARWYSNAGLFADVDGDGHPDLIIGNYFPDGARILDSSAGGYERMQESMSRATNGGTHHLLRWTRIENGLPLFTEVTDWVPSDAQRAWTLAVGAADLDGDLRPELYFANDFGPDQLLHNRSIDGHVRFEVLHGRREFFTPASKVLSRDSFKGMGVDFGDVNGDGRFDIFVSNIAEKFALEENHFLFVSTGDPSSMRLGIAPYVDRSESLGVARSGWAWDAKMADFDNDGTLEIVQATGFVRGDVNRWPELHELAMSNDALLTDPQHWPRIRAGDDLSGHEHNPFFVRRAGGRYFDVAAFIGTAQLQVTRGIAVADVDGDGLLDFAAANQWEPSTVYKNVTHNANAFLGLHVLFDEGKTDAVRHVPGHPTGRPGSPAVGAVVTIRNPGRTPVVAQVDGGAGHSGKRSPDVLVGLGTVPADTKVDASIVWRTSSGIRRFDVKLRPGWHTIWLTRR